MRKLGLPAQPELAMGAIASGGIRVLNPVEDARVPPSVIDEVATAEQRAPARDLLERARRVRSAHANPLSDDGGE